MDRVYLTDLDGIEVVLRWHQVVIAANLIHKICGISIEHKLESMHDTTGYYKIFITKKVNKGIMRDITIAAICAKMC